MRQTALLNTLVTAAVAFTSISVISQAEASPLLSCGSGQVRMPVDLSTGSAVGAALPVGAVDSDWPVTSSPNGAGPAEVISPPGAYVTAPTGSAWIASTASSLPAGDYAFTYTIVIPPSGSLNGFTLTFAADNGVKFDFNGTPIGGYPASGASGFNTLHTLTVATPAAIVGVNTLTATVHNNEGPTALVIFGETAICVRNLAECEAAGVVVTKGGALVSRIGDANAVANPPIGTRPPDGTPMPPSPAIHDDNALADRTISISSFGELTAQAAYGRCDVGKTYRDAYGAAGAAHVQFTAFTSPPIFVNAHALMVEAELYKAPTLGSDHTCRTGAVDVQPGGSLVPTCNSVVTPPGLPAVVTANETWGPVVGADGATHYGSAALHVLFDLPGSVNDIDVYVGYVDLAIS